MGLNSLENNPGDEVKLALRSLEKSRANAAVEMPEEGIKGPREMFMPE